RARNAENTGDQRSLVMSARIAVPALCLALGACASSGGAGGDRVSVSAEGVLARGGAPRADTGFVYAERGCIPFALNGSQSLDFLCDPQRVVQTNDYIGPMIFAVPAGAYTLTVRAKGSVDVEGHEVFPTAPLTVQARHFYSVDCVRSGNQVAVSIGDHDHVGSRQ